MKTAKLSLISILMILVLGLAGAIIAQEDDNCPIMVEQALAQAGEICTGMGRNEACYGNVQVVATDWNEAPLIEFESPGDIADILNIRTLNTAAFDASSHIWGIALLALQADLPDTLPGQNVTFVVLGSVQIQSEVIVTDDAAQAITLIGRTINSVNVRSGPGTNYAVIGSLTGSTEITLVGRNEAEDWLRVDFNGQEGWIFAQLLDVDGDAALLSVIGMGERQAVAYTQPMQAFRLTTGIGNPACDTVPPDGLLIHAPSATTVHFRINGVDLIIGSTAFLTAPTETELQVSTFDGTVSVTSGEVTQTVTPGFTITVVEGEPPSQPAPYRPSTMRTIPVQLLPEVIDIAAAPGLELDAEATEIPILPGDAITITVPATADWVSSGITLNAGQSFSVLAWGIVNIFADCEHFNATHPEQQFPCAELVVGPGGRGGLPAEYVPAEVAQVFPMLDASYGSLVGRIGSGPPFAVGPGGIFTANTSGMLQFIINDDLREDNSGELTVSVVVGE